MLFLLVLITVVLIFFLLLQVIRTKDIKTPVFSIAAKEQIQAEGRELSDNQMRTAKIHIGSIRVLLREEVDRQFTDMSPLQLAYMDLLIGKITDNLLEQFRIDLVRNHIVKKSEDELKVYTQAKAQTYYTKIKVYLDDYNYNIPAYDFKKIVDVIPFQKFYNIYYTSYLSAKQLSVGY